MPPVSVKIGYGEHGKLQHGKLKPVFHYLPVVDLETLPVSKLELFLTIPNDFQPLTTLVKISTEFFNLHIAAKIDH